MKKKLIIIVGAILVVVIAMVVFYFYGLMPVSSQGEEISFTVVSGDGKRQIIDKLDDAGLIKSKISAYIYVGLHQNLNLQAGEYMLSPTMSLQEILNELHQGDVVDNHNTFHLTFVKGEKLVDYAQIIAQATGTMQEEVINTLADPTYLQELINEYWFLSEDILNEEVYYPLEGYLFASTYEFYQGSSIQDIVKRMLDGMDQILRSYQEEIEASEYSVHELLTLASIVEVEGSTSDDRAGVA